MQPDHFVSFSVWEDLHPHMISETIDTTPPGIGNYAYFPYKNLPYPHLQLIGVNSEELSLTSVIQCLLSCVKLKLVNHHCQPFLNVRQDAKDDYSCGRSQIFGVKWRFLQKPILYCTGNLV